MSAPRLIGLLALALAVVTGVAYAASQTVAARDPERPDRSRDRAPYVSAPAPAVLPPEVPPGEPLGPPEVDPGWLTATASVTGVPLPALRAYARAHLAQPLACEVGWTTLAGIGWVESHHGTLGGRTVGGDARPSTPIVGPALDGRGRFASIPATPAGTRMHGDRRWEHAVGPLQFLPDSWARWRSDGDGDGATDPHDLDDAAAAAVRYLCADGHDLTTGAGWTGAVFSYNHAQEYVAAVHAAATRYARLAAGIPAG